MHWNSCVEITLENHLQLLIYPHELMITINNLFNYSPNQNNESCHIYVFENLDITKADAGQSLVSWFFYVSIAFLDLHMDTRKKRFYGTTSQILCNKTLDLAAQVILGVPPIQVSIYSFSLDLFPSIPEYSFEFSIH